MHERWQEEAQGGIRFSGRYACSLWNKPDHEFFLLEHDNLIIYKKMDNFFKSKY